jgi:hypothetical protein
MSKQTNKQYQEDLIKPKTTVSDDTPWFWQIKNSNLFSIRWFNFLWIRATPPDKPFHWDNYYNTTTRKREIYTAQPYRWFWVDEYEPDRIYTQWEYVTSGWFLFRYDNITWSPPPPPDPSYRKYDNSLWFRATQNQYYCIASPSVNQVIPWSTQTIVALGNFMDRNNNTLKWTNAIITQTNDLVSLYWTVLLQSVPSNTTVKLKLIMSWTMLWLPTEYVIDYDEYTTPNITAVTTGTDSLSWPITATTTISISPQDVVLKASWIIQTPRFDTWEWIIQLQVVHNNVSPITLLAVNWDWANTFLSCIVN